MAQTPTSIIKSTSGIIFSAYLFLLPLAFLTLTSNYFDTTKLALTVIVAGLGLLLWATHTIVKKAFTFTVTPLLTPLLLIIVTTLLSVFVSGSNTVAMLTGKGTYLPALALIALLFPTLSSGKKFANLGFLALIGSATVLSTISIFQSLGFGLSRLINSVFSTTIPDTLAFTPAGNPLALISFLLPVLVTTLILAFTQKESLEKVILFLVSAIMGAGTILVFLYSFPGKDTAPVFLPLRNGYAIAIESLKTPKTALFGFGPESFVTAYNQLRPATMNLGNFWNIRFTNSSNELFEVITTTGILGLIAWITLAGAVIRINKKVKLTTETKVLVLGAFISLFLLILLPATYLHLFVIFAFITLIAQQLKTDRQLVKTISANLSGISLVRPDHDGVRESELSILPYAAALPMVALTLAVFFFGARAYSAETKFKASLDAAAKDDGVATYEFQRQAIQTNPYLSRYRRTYATTNLALANALASKDEVSDQDKQNISQLIQQSIREAKAAVTLEPQNATNWESLTSIYRALIGVAEGADQWTIAALSQAVKTDPTNPRLRLDLGGIYYSLKQYDSAIRFYQQAAELKPDWANAYYNLAAAHKEKKEFNAAYDYLTQVIALVDPTSADYTKVQDELKELADKVTVAQPQTPEAQAPQGQLNLPAPAPTTSPQTQVNLDEASGPESLGETTSPEALPTPPPVVSESPTPEAPILPEEPLTP